MMRPKTTEEGNLVLYVQEDMIWEMVGEESRGALEESME